MNATDKDSNKMEESALDLEKEKVTITSQKEHVELSNTKESFVKGPQAEVISNATKDSDNRTAIMESGVASDKMRDGCNTILCSATSTNTNEPSSIASQEASAERTKDTTNPEGVEGDKPSSMELPDDGSHLHGKVGPSSMQQHESNLTRNSNTKGTLFDLIHYCFHCTPLRNVPQSRGFKLLQVGLMDQSLDFLPPTRIKKLASFNCFMENCGYPKCRTKNH